MYVLVLSQGEEQRLESLDLAAIPEYTEIEQNGNLVPLTRFSFTEDGPVDIFWKTVPFLSKSGRGLVEGTVRVDAYCVSNAEAKAYIRAREAYFEETKERLTAQGYEVSRAFFGSQDGEAIVYRKQGETDWHILTHMDAEFAEKGSSEVER